MFEINEMVALGWLYEVKSCHQETTCGAPIVSLLHNLP